MNNNMIQETIVRLADVNKIYRQGELQVKAVDNLSLELHRGEFTALSGPSGSGKTTILNIIGGLDVPTSGTVELEGNNLAELGRTDLHGTDQALKFGARLVTNASMPSWPSAMPMAVEMVTPSRSPASSRLDS